MSIIQVVVCIIAVAVAAGTGHTGGSAVMVVLAYLLPGTKDEQQR